MPYLSGIMFEERVRILILKYYHMPAISGGWIVGLTLDFIDRSRHSQIWR